MFLLWLTLFAFGVGGFGLALVWAINTYGDFPDFSNQLGNGKTVDLAPDEYDIQ